MVTKKLVTTARAPLRRAVLAALGNGAHCRQYASLSIYIWDTGRWMVDGGVGEWEELKDSLPSGSGFSFVDLAADRSGARFASQGLEERSATVVADRLRRASEQDLLPSILLAGPEGLHQPVFKDRYGSLEEDRYGKAVVAIDRALVAQEDFDKARLRIP